MSERPEIMIFDHILSRNDLDNSYYRAIISTLATALKREEHALISFQTKIPSKKISEFVRYVVCSFCPSTVSVLSKNNSFQYYGNKSANHNNDDDDPGNHSKKKSSGKNPNSPFLANVCIVEDFDQLSDTSPIIKVMKELAFTMEDEDQPTTVPVPFLLIALVNENSHLPRNTLGAFSFHINIQSLPTTIQSHATELYSTYDSFSKIMTPQDDSQRVFIHRDITTYISQLVLNVDCKPLLTSFIEVKTKLLLVKTIEDFALLNNRYFIISDDVQMIFPMLMTHRFLLPGSTSFKDCLDFIYKLIDTLPVPF